MQLKENIIFCTDHQILKQQKASLQKQCKLENGGFLKETSLTFWEKRKPCQSKILFPMKRSFKKKEMPKDVGEQISL